MLTMEVPQALNCFSPPGKNGRIYDFFFQSSLLNFALNSTTPKRLENDTVLSDSAENVVLNTPTEIHEVSQQCFLSPDLERLRRGRPRAECISSLILEGSAMKGNIQCNICKRVFPREKSLQAHMRTHTGERPYVCNYPGCQRAFCQSGQLKTHQRLHTGEKPFICSVAGCPNRFTHANRHCATHPMALLKRDSSAKRSEQSCVSVLSTFDNNDCDNGTEWLNKTQTPIKPSVLRRQLAAKRVHDSDSDAENRSSNDSDGKTIDFRRHSNNEEEPCDKIPRVFDPSTLATPAKSVVEKADSSLVASTPHRDTTLQPSNALNVSSALRTPVKPLQLAQLLSASGSETPKVKVNNTSEFRDKLLGALALIELATSPPRHGGL